MKRLGRGCLIGVGVLVVLIVLGALLNRGGGRPTTAQPVAGVPTAAVDAVGAAPTMATPAPAPTGASTTPPAAQRYNVGETADFEGLKITVNEVTASPGSDVFKPKDGQQFILVNVTLENTTAKDVQVSSILHTELKDETGQAYGVDLLAAGVSGGKQPEGTIVPGDKLRGAFGYQVPTTTTGLQWIFKQAIGSKRVVFDVAP